MHDLTTNFLFHVGCLGDQDLPLFYRPGYCIADISMFPMDVGSVPPGAMQLLGPGHFDEHEASQPITRVGTRLYDPMNIFHFSWYYGVLPAKAPRVQ